MRSPSPLKELLQTGNAWWIYFNKNKNNIRDSIVTNIIKLLACGLLITGYKEYHCENNNCTHTKKIAHSCKSRFCSTCGKILTDKWCQQQRSIMPKSPMQHITFTMPDVYWPYFKENRNLLNLIAKAAANTILDLAKKKGLRPAIFIAIHTFGHNLKWNIHIHLSVSMGGLTFDNKAWKNIKFSKKAVMPMWRYNVTKLIRDAMKDKSISTNNNIIDQQYQKKWIVHFSEATKDATQTIKYLGCYIKRPPLSMSKLKHYDGQTVTFKYLDRRDNNHRTATYNIDDFLDRFTQHIPDKGFRMIRYYGILANSVRGKLLPIVYNLLGQNLVKPITLTFAFLMKSSFGINPFKCILCGSRMIFSDFKKGLSHKELIPYHKELATRQIIYN